MPPRRLRGLDAAVGDAYEELAKNPFRPGAEIYRELKRIYGEKRAPSERAIQRDLRTRRPKSDSDPWSLSSADSDDVAVVLPVLAVVIRESDGRRKHVTLAEVELFKKIRAAVPEMEPWDVYAFALRYRLAAERQDSEQLRRLDAELAIKPWDGPEQANAFGQAFGERHDGVDGSVTLFDYPIPLHIQKKNMREARE